MKVSESNIGKLVIGQKVLIKLDAYPFITFGVIEGELSHISISADKDNFYWGNVHLPRKLKTRQGFVITYRTGMKGKAEIVTSEKRLTERLLILERKTL